MRFVVEVLPSKDESVQGTVRQEGRDQAMSFCGWLELLRLLEPAGARPEPQQRHREDVFPGAREAHEF